MVAVVVVAVVLVAVAVGVHGSGSGSGSDSGSGSGSGRVIGGGDSSSRSTAPQLHSPSAKPGSTYLPRVVVS